MRGRRGGRPLFDAVVILEFPLALLSDAQDLVLWQSVSPYDSAVPDDVVGLALLAPVADRRTQANGLTVVRQPPTRGVKRSTDLGATATGAKVDRGAVAAGQVELAVFRYARDLVNEFGRDLVESPPPHRLAS